MMLLAYRGRSYDLFFMTFWNHLVVIEISSCHGPSINAFAVVEMSVESAATGERELGLDSHEIRAFDKGLCCYLSVFFCVSNAREFEAIAGL